MNPISITGTIAAALNYKRAKEEYESLLDQKEEEVAKLAAISAGHFITADDLDNAVNMMPGVEIIPLVRISNIRGYLFQLRTTLTLRNTSDSRYYIVNAGCKVYFDTEDGEEYFIAANEQKVGKWLEPKESLVIELEREKVYEETGELIKAIRNKILEVSGKSALSDVDKFDALGFFKTSVKVDWENEIDVTTKKIEAPNVKCIMRYCKVGNI